ncbi:MAG: hypothetical protein GY777_25080 [Candidatus Brocadiaceae bacterium]|nr:hypothetical protein [Candidatus Brocadiaceae bacterium]
MSKISNERYRFLFKEKDTQKFNSMDFIHRFTSPILAILFSELFWPDFVEIDNMVFLENTFEDGSDLKRFNDAVKKYEGDRKKTEISFNTIEIPSLFGAHMGDTTDDEDLILARTIKSMWKARLADKFPNKKFLVEVIDSEKTGGEIAVIFHQV